MNALKTTLLHVAGCLATLFSTSPLGAAPLGIAGIPKLVSDADVIVVGSVASVEGTQLNSGQIVLRVNGILKGDYTNGLLYLSYNAGSVGTEQAMLGMQVLAFGKLNLSGGYDLLPMAYGPTVNLTNEILNVGAPAVVPGLEVDSQDNPLEKVIKELALTQFGPESISALPYLLPLAAAGVEPVLMASVFHTIQSSGPGGANTGAVGLVAMGDIDGLVAAISLNVSNIPNWHQSSPRLRSPITTPLKLASKY